MTCVFVLKYKYMLMAQCDGKTAEHSDKGENTTVEECRCDFECL